MKNSAYDNNPNKRYLNRYWKKEYFDAMKIIRDACQAAGEPNTTDCSLRWLMHHSAMSMEYNDGVILGASSLSHLQSNITSAEGQPLPQSVIDAFDEAWTITRPVCEKYFRP